MDTFEMEAPMGGDIIRLHARIAALEEKLATCSDGFVLDFRAQSLAPILEALAKQRAVNEALLSWHEAPGYEERIKRFDAVSAALREALKP